MDIGFTPVHKAFRRGSSYADVDFSKQARKLGEAFAKSGVPCKILDFSELHHHLSP